LDEFLGVPSLFLTSGHKRLAKRQEEDSSKCWESWRFSDQRRRCGSSTRSGDSWADKCCDSVALPPKHRFSDGRPSRNVAVSATGACTHGTSPCRDDDDDGNGGTEQTHLSTHRPSCPLDYGGSQTCANCECAPGGRGGCWLREG
jgi:hypothetical protein